LQRHLYDDDHETYRQSVREFVDREVSPHYEDWERRGLVDRDAWVAAGAHDIIGLAIPSGLGGCGVDDYRFRMVVAEEMARAGATSFAAGLAVHDDIVTPYLLDLASPQQQARWLPGIAAGTTIGAIAMTEPGAGSDLRGVRTTAELDGDTWVVNGQKTFITSGLLSGLVVVLARTNADPAAYSLLVVEEGTPGFTRGRKLDKVGLAAQDTAELFFDNATVPAANLLGEAGLGLRYLRERLPRERLSIASSAQASARTTFAETVRYVFDRQAFGRSLGDFQHVRFELAEMSTELDLGESFLDSATLALEAGELSAVDAAKLKWWLTEMQKRVVDRCLQLHGGYGYMTEYAVARAFRDSRVQTIYGGTTEIMKEIIGRDIARSSARQPH
jgi:alkylation response protein AidB-like acyl-CoA dehydrogenase